ncbi:hypothetical protein QBC38DRAFT_107475 [Podospora fimiseda]|uniref:Uncharacterized protein n=1 Tax=Podospora fimiseda TaxID=252190 RepID=A0AAN6YNY2_9PEZI|nr:hypothetical protein QBC38DRAFT_107475 [Podospora fimiseda]
MWTPRMVCCVCILPISLCFGYFYIIYCSVNRVGFTSTKDDFFFSIHTGRRERTAVLVSAALHLVYLLLSPGIQPIGWRDKECKRYQVPMAES